MEKWRVTAARENQPKLAPVKLQIRGIQDSIAGTISFPFTYLHPSTVVSGLEGEGGFPFDASWLVIYQEGQTAEVRPSGIPVVDDTVLDSAGVTWQVLRVETTMNYEPLWAVHRCLVKRMV